jgi:hypothetical protein
MVAREMAFEFEAARKAPGAIIECWEPSWPPDPEPGDRAQLLDKIS